LKFLPADRRHAGCAQQHRGAGAVARHGPPRSDDRNRRARSPGGGAPLL